MTFLTRSDLRNKILKYWHKVTGYHVYDTEFYCQGNVNDMVFTQPKKNQFPSSAFMPDWTRQRSAQARV
jgi:hypothetical protein